MYLSKYGTARHIYIAIPKAGSANHAVSADWTPAAGDVKISKDGGAAANVTNLPTAIAMGNSTIWDFSLTATEMQAAQIIVTVSDSATKAVDDTGFSIETYGNASAQHVVDLSDGVRAGLTALPNAAAEAAGGLYTRGTGAGQIAQDANGNVRVNLDTIKTNPVVNGGTVTFPTNATLASTTNITAGTVTTATNVTTVNGLAADVITSTALAASAVTEIQTGLSTLDAAGVRSAVGLASANMDTQLAAIAGYIDTEVAAILAAVGALPTAVQNADALLGRNVAGGSSTGRLVKEAFYALRNKWTSVAGVYSVYQTDDTTVSWTSTLSTDAAAEPLIGSDPA